MMTFCLEELWFELSQTLKKLRNYCALKCTRT